MSTISLSTQRGMDSQGVHDGDWVGFEVVVIDDHAVFAEALATALRTQPDFADVRVARDTATARQLLAERAPDLVLVDLRLGEQDGLSFLGEIPDLAPTARAVMLTGHLQRDVVIRSRDLGGWAALPKGMSLGELLTALRSVLSGERLFHVGTSIECSEGLLTAREAEVLQLLANGEDPQQIARLLGLSPYTVRDYIKSARAKLKVQTQLAAVVAAASLGIVELPSR